MATRVRKSSGSVRGRRVRRIRSAGKKGTISRQKIARAVREVSSRKR